MEDVKICQGCGEEMSDEKDNWGTNDDGSPSEEYCQYCLVNGHLFADFSVERIVDSCVGQILCNEENITEEEARARVLDDLKSEPEKK